MTGCLFERVEALLEQRRAAGVIGLFSGLKSARTLRKYLDGAGSPGIGGPSSGGRNARISSIGEGAACQIPDRSGLPFAARGAGAFKLGLPSLVRGVPGVG